MAKQKKPPQIEKEKVSPEVELDLEESEETPEPQLAPETIEKATLQPPPEKKDAPRLPPELSTGSGEKRSDIRTAKTVEALTTPSASAIIMPDSILGNLTKDPKEIVTIQALKSIDPGPYVGGFRFPDFIVKHQYRVPRGVANHLAERNKAAIVQG